MGAINFNKPSSGTVDVNKENALKVTYTGEEGHAFWSQTTNEKGGAGVVGVSKNWIGVHGQSVGGSGVYGFSTKGAAVKGESEEGTGVFGLGKGKGAGVYGESIAADGVKGVSTNAAGVAGSSTNSYGIWGYSTGNLGIYGASETVHGVYGHSNGHDGIKGETHREGFAGVAGFNWTNKGFGIWGAGGEWAGFFDGNASVTGELQVGKDITLLNADCAEEFDVMEENVEVGTVMVLTKDGSLQPSYQEYDKKVAGIVSGANGFKPAIVLDSQHSQNHKNKEQHNYKNEHRLPIALMGKVYCKVDARQSSIQVGDLLTTSPTKGCAMKAEDSMKAFGAVIGKALGSIRQGLGMIPVLVTLQ